MQIKLKKRSQIKVWLHIQNPQTLLNQCLWIFYWNIVYTASYANVYKHSYNKNFLFWRLQDLKNEITH